MPKLLPFFLVSALSGLVSLTVNAQASVAAVEDSVGVDSQPDSLRLVKGFGLAIITEPGGKTHQVYVPAGRTGFAGLLPFYRREEDIRVLGQPWSISVDKVQKMRLQGVYYEHIVLNGKRKHLLAARVASGPVELFNYTEVSQVAAAVAGGLVGAAVAAAVLAGANGAGIPDRRWFVRRGAELVQVRRNDFTLQMNEFFQDDPATVSALTQQQLRYPDMLAIVQAYNQHKLNPYDATR